MCKKTEVKYIKLENGENCIELSSVYKNNCSEQIEVIITDDILSVYEETRKSKEKKRSWNRRHGNKKIYLGNEDFEASLGMITHSPAEKIYSNLYIQFLRKQFDEKIFTRGIMHYLHKYTEAEIAELENVSQAAVSRSIINFKKKMAMLYNIELGE